MTDSKYAKYLITELKKNIQVPSFRSDKPGQGFQPDKPKKEHVVWLDNEVIPDCKIYSECVWYWPWQRSKDMNKDDGLKEHTHTFEEVIAFFGTDLNDPHALNGEIELWLDGEQHMLTKTFMAYVPAGMKHGPLIIHRVDKPIFHFTIGPAQKYA